MIYLIAIILFFIISIFFMHTLFAVIQNIFIQGIIIGVVAAAILFACQRIKRRLKSKKISS